MKFTKNPKNLIYGKHPIMEALEAGKEFDKIFVKSPTSNEQLLEIKKKARALGILVQTVPEQKLKRLTNANHQGVAGFLSLINYYKVEDILSNVYAEGKLPLFLVLDGITDVRNFGAIVRTAKCFNADAVVLAKTNAAGINADAIKASAGALNDFKVCKVEDLAESLRYLKDNGLKIAATSITESNFIYKSDFNLPLAIIIGSEEKGISKENLMLADEEIQIPYSGNFDSLNASVATGVILYEIERQRRAG